MAQNESIHFEVVLPEQYVEEMITTLRNQIAEDQTKIQKFKRNGWDMGSIKGTISRCAASCLTLSYFEIAYSEYVK